MAEAPASSHAPPPPPPPTPPSAPENPDPTQYWCYQCEKRVPIETLPGQAEVICFECKSGFVELISVNHHQTFEFNDDDDQPAFGNEILQVLRLLAMAARDDDAPPPPPADRDVDGDDNDYLRIELDGWDENDEDDDDDDDDDDDNEDEDEEDENPNPNPNQVDRVRNRSDADNENEDEQQQIVEQEDETDDLRRRLRRDVIRLRLRDFAARPLSRRHRILDWAEILTGLEDNSLEFRFQAPGDGYIGNPGDYVDAAGYEALLQSLAESDNGAKRGAPPAASSAIEALPVVKVKSTETEVCAICKDKLLNNEEEIVKQLPCGHMYHGECIVPWLGSRNTCPVCRYELPTDDPEYEEDRKKRLTGMVATSSMSSDDAV